MNFFALDIGDVHTGIARSDALGLFATPQQSIATNTLELWLNALVRDTHAPITIVVGLPKTMRGTASAQTNKLMDHYHELQNKFTTITWLLWDERLTSKQAQSMSRAAIKKDKNYEHAVAAAIILQAYLEHRRFKQHAIDK